MKCKGFNNCSLFLQIPTALFIGGSSTPCFHSIPYLYSLRTPNNKENERNKDYRFKGIKERPLQEELFPLRSLVSRSGSELFHRKELEDAVVERSDKIERSPARPSKTNH